MSILTIVFGIFIGLLLGRSLSVNYQDGTFNFSFVKFRGDFIRSYELISNWLVQAKTSAIESGKSAKVLFNSVTEKLDQVNSVTDKVE